MGFGRVGRQIFIFHFFNDSPHDNETNDEARVIYHTTLRLGVVNHRNMAIEHCFRHGIIERRENMAVWHVAKQLLAK